MKALLKRLLAFACMYLLQTAAFAQYPFWNDIQAFKVSDSLNMPEPNSILLIGSSTFTKWTDVQDYFPNQVMLNRAFGGSTLPDVIRYADDIIFPYHPKQILIYCGENDFVTSDTITAETVADRAIQLFRLIRRKLPTIDIAYVSIKPSPSRQALWPKMVAANALIKNYFNLQVHAVFIDVYAQLLTPDGQPRPELFVADMLHMNKTGYGILQKAIAPYLIP
ncbi:GDSL-type esterase/lipase family protein [Deminuibacter soli]|uniref:G-D-S-L family lipolytic protein n=1 Tax=Deminuibacter soli TaxID=2291815 RepID=A0A3E1NPR6_9BACT|nr:GDSL-type esterase/lipase family protein [Deminuibacter soli]RFM29939.1 G-D-S-L family lipolytic protein [Deminuibacter soli]